MQGNEFTREQEKALERLSPFQLKNRLIELAQTDHERMMLNAGRGNPNWTAIAPRQAFFSLGRFATSESSRTFTLPSMGGHVDSEGMLARFEKALSDEPSDPGLVFLKQSLDYAKAELGLDPEGLLAEFCDGIIGSHYPTPDRMLSQMETVVHKYLQQEMCDGNPPPGRFDLFATEGGTAAMCYIFNSLMENKFLHKGDKIALGTPIFTPYLEIPHLNDFELLEVEVMGDEHNDWQVPFSELDKLADPDVKAFFLVNPSNPGSTAMQKESLDYLGKLVKEKRRDLIILTDDVYGTFVNGFHSFMAVAPFNTICVYSFSKYFGATGWRLGVIAIHENNMFDKAIAALPQEDKDALGERYGSVIMDVPSMKFIDRLVADSRAVALNHTAGLSTPQQVQMALFSLMGLLDKDSAYKKLAQQVVSQRFNDLYKSVEVAYSPNPNDAHYYTTIDVLEIAQNKFGDEFGAWMKDNFEPVDFVLRLAEERQVVLLPGAGFDAPDWTVRVSLANLDDEAYVSIGQQIKSLVEEYFGQWKDSSK
jgi:aspartate 4-decarboxylase